MQFGSVIFLENVPVVVYHRISLSPFSPISAVAFARCLANASPRRLRRVRCNILQLPSAIKSVMMCYNYQYPAVLKYSG